MIRIHLEDKCESAKIRIEGKISGASVEELERFCRELLAHRQHRIVDIELDHVSIIDANGEELLQSLCRLGVNLRGRGMHSQYLVERIRERRAS